MLAARSEHYDRGIQCFDQGRYEEAIAAFQATLEDRRASAVVLRLARFYLGEAYSALAQADSGSDASITNLKAAIALHPQFADLHFQLGSAFLVRGDYREAHAALSEALRINPRYVRAALLRGAALYGSGQSEAGLREARAALSTDSPLTPALLAHVEEAHAAGDRAEVVRRLMQLSQPEDNAALKYARLAQNLYRREMFADALESYRQAVALAPGYADLRCQLGMTHFALGQDAEAEQAFEKALEINPRFIEAWQNLGLVRQRRGNHFDAATCFERVLEIDGGNLIARERLETLKKAA
jgi:tetratricopeptide (TPR) repeat protein